MNKTCGVFREVQLRHAKRMVKIMEHLLKFPEEHALLDILAAEEHEKRIEDLNEIMSSVDVKSNEVKKTIEVLAREITDGTVVYFLQRQIQKLKDLHAL